MGVGPREARRMDLFPSNATTTDGDNARSPSPTPAPREGKDARRTHATPAATPAPPVPAAAAEPGEPSEGARDVARLLSVMAEAYQHLCAFRCRDCVSLLRAALPPRHLRSGWAQLVLGRAFNDMCDYRAALLSLKEMLRLEPFRVAGVEVLSTVLWHLKKDKELSVLAQQVVEVDKLAPETWCVVGNCFSLQKETDAAIRFFQRALQVDPGFTYAHTLCGHELVNNEDLDKAVASYRMALLNDERHYNAWYGLGSVYYRQEKYEAAEYHFRRALQVNGESSVLKCYLAMVLHAQALGAVEAGTAPAARFLQDPRTVEALRILSDAAADDTKNPQVHFQKVTILWAGVNAMRAAALEEEEEEEEEGIARPQLALLEEILAELEVVVRLAPRESPVYAMLGQVHQMMGHGQQALRCFNTALDLDPEKANTLKGNLESL